MPFEKGRSGNPAGKPKGAKDKRTALRALLEPQAALLVQKTMDMALKGDTTALRLCLERLISPMKSRDEPVRLNRFGDTLAVQGRTVLKAMATGEITPNEAATLMQSISAQARVVEVEELTERVAALEQALGR